VEDNEVISEPPNPAIQLSVLSLVTWSSHDEIFTFTGVEGTKHWN